MFAKILIALFSATFMAGLWFGYAVTDSAIAFECFEGISYIRGYFGYIANNLPGFVVGISFASLVFFVFSKG